MKLNKTMKRILAYVCAIAMVITSITFVPSQNVSAGSAEGLTLAEDDMVTEGGWKFYRGGAGGTAGEVYYGGGATADDDFTLYIQKTTNNEWGIQIWSPEMTGLTEGTEYQYTIKFTADKEGSFKVKEDVTNSAQVKASYTAGENEVKGVFTAGATAKFLLADFTGTADDTTFVITDISITDDFEKEVVELPDEAKWAATERNLALNKTVEAEPWRNEGSKTQITDGICYEWNNFGAITVEGTNTGYYDIDLEKTYAANSIDEVVVWWRTGDANFYPNNGYKIQFSTGNVFTTVAEVKKEDYPETTGTAWEDGNQYMIPVVLDKASITGNVSKVRIFVDSPAGYGAQVAEIAVLAENPQEGEALPKCDAPASVTATSDDYNSITYTVEAAEGQEELGYKYLVYAGDTLISASEGVEAGTYTANNIAKGTYKIKAIAICEGMDASDAVEQAEEVTVADLNEAIAKENEEQVLGTKNITNTANNADAKVASVSSYYEGHSIDTAGVAIDGVLKSGEGSDAAIRTAANEQPAEIVIDLGNTYSPAEFEKVIIGYSNPRTYAANTTVSFSADGENYEVVAEKTGYECKKDNAATADLNGVELDKISEYTAKSVRYVKVSLTGGGNGWGYVINEIGVILNKDVADAAIVTDKTPVEAPEIQSKVYTGELLTADIENTAEYTVTTNEGGTNAGTYDVVLTLEDPDNYYWSGDPKANQTTKTLSFEITKATDNELIEDVEIEDWTYGEDASEPTAVAKYGEPTFVYSDSEDGEYTDEVPTLPGTYFVKAIVEDTDNYNGVESAEAFEFDIWKGDQDAPEGVSTIDATSEENADGSIIGVTDAMEYRAADDETYDEEADDYVYTKIEGTSVDGLKAGKYFVRYAETDYLDSSEDVEVEIKAGRKLNITLTAGTGYTLTGTTDPVEYNADYTFTLTLDDGYKKESNPVVKVNGEVVTAGEDGTYAVKVTADIVITVEGVVADTTETTSQNPTTEKPQESTTSKPATTSVQKPAKVKVKSLSKKKSAKKLVVKFKKAKRAKGYQIAVYSSKKNAKKNKKALVKKNTKKLKYTVKSKKLKNKKTLYVKVRAYALDGKTKVYGSWSKAKKVKVK